MTLAADMTMPALGDFSGDVSRYLRKQAEAGTRLFRRFGDDPILTKEDWPYPIGSLFNVAAAQVGTDTVLLARHEDPRGISQLTVVRMADGCSSAKIADEPLISDVWGDSSCAWGVEDPRVTYVSELGGWVIAYAGYAPGGPRVMLALTRDFESVEYLGEVLAPEDKNASLLPSRVDGQWIVFHRPEVAGTRDIWISRSPDLKTWVRDSQPLMKAGVGASWCSARIGMGPAPILTPRGNWLAVTHGVKAMVSNDIYCMGIALLDHDLRVLRRAPGWVLRPHRPWERMGDVPNVVFPAGAVYDEDIDRLRVYYGAADLCVGLVEASMIEVEDYLLSLDPEYCNLLSPTM